MAVIFLRRGGLEWIVIYSAYQENGTFSCGLAWLCLAATRIVVASIRCTGFTRHVADIRTRKLWSLAGTTHQTSAMTQVLYFLNTVEGSVVYMKSAMTEIFNFCETNFVCTLLISCINGSPGPLQAGRFSISKTRLLGIIPRCLYYKNATPRHYRVHFCFVPFCGSWWCYYIVLSPYACTDISSYRLCHLAVSSPSHDQ